MNLRFPDIVSRFEAEIEDADEETFLLYSQPIQSRNLGFIDTKATSLDLVVGGRDYTIHQSPGVLSSTRAGGTTGAVLWKITPLFAEWISAPDNILFKSGALDKLSSIVELGCGISPLNALALLPHVSRYVLTDQPYVHKLIQQNLEENNAAVSSASSSRRPAKLRKGGVSKSSSSLSSSSASAQTAEIRFETLDWETDEVSASLTGDTDAISFDAVIACDCVFNYALVQPFVQTCVDVCRLREAEEDAVVSSGDSAVDGRRRPCLCIIAQQLRNDDVFRSWLSAFMESFHVWRMPEEMLPAQLRPGAGFVVHVGILRDSVHSDSSR